LGSSYTAITGDIIKHSELIVDVSAGTVMLGHTTDNLALLIEGIGAQSKSEKRCQHRSPRIWISNRKLAYANRVTSLLPMDRGQS